jgi:lipoprotein-anchoring transpeptidase ErfK/SrfK
MPRKAALKTSLDDQHQLGPGPFLISRPRRPRTAESRPNWWQDGVLVATLCFLFLGLSGLAIRLAQPLYRTMQPTVKASALVLSSTFTRTSTATTVPVTVTPTRTLATPIPTVTKTPVLGLQPTATPRWVSERYLPLPVTEKWIEVDVSNQKLRAFNGETLVFSATISTGSNINQSSLGKYRLTQKEATRLLTGPGYYLPDVPWVMEINRDLMLLGAYWQDSWGVPSTYGSINLKPADAKWLYDWTSPSVPAGQQSILATAQDQGTWVIIHP